MAICPGCKGTKTIPVYNRDGFINRQAWRICSLCRGQGKIGQRSFSDLVDAISDPEDKTPLKKVHNDTVDNTSPKHSNDTPIARASIERPRPESPREPTAGVFTEGFPHDRAAFSCDLAFRPGTIPAVFELLGGKQKRPTRFYLKGGYEYADNAGGTICRPTP